MRKAVWPSLCLALVIALWTSCAWALERQLAGVRLGDHALQLLDRSEFGEPNFIGPLGTLGYTTGQAQRAAPAAGGAAGRAGPVGPARGARAGGARGGPGMRGGARGGMRGGMRGGPGMRGGAMGGGQMAGRAGAMRGGAAAAAPRATGGPATEGAGMYWYYRRPGGAVMVLSLSPIGEVRAITLSGNMPYFAGRTSRGVGLTSTYMEIISQYGYPDQVLTAGATIELTYADHGVRFTLDNMRVREIAIGPHIAAAAQAAPEAGPEAPPPAGLSTEELRGYL